MNVYSIHNLKKTSNNRTLLDIDQLQVETGLIYALLGPNGAGKTTLLNILGFLDHPTSGSLKFFGKHVRFNESVLQPLRRQVVVLDQYPVLFTCSVYKNIEFGLKIRKIGKNERERRINQVLELVDMQVFKFAPAHNLSGGETQRIALARALALTPKIFLCDEPVASVDLENQRTIISILKRINKVHKMTIIFTTHDRILASELSHKTLVLNKGYLVGGGYENNFPCQVEKIAGNLIRCQVTDTISFDLKNKHTLPVTEKGRIAIDPEKIDVMPAVKNKSHILQGHIVQLRKDGNQIRLDINIGVVVTALISQERYDEFRPGIGDLVGIVPHKESITLHK